MTVFQILLARIAAFLNGTASDDFIIYTYETFDADQFGVNKWQRFKTVKGLNNAIKHAHVLKRQNKFEKIEIKRNWVQSQTGRQLSKTMMTL